MDSGKQNQPTTDFKPYPKDLSYEPGPFDIIGDVHGCWDELLALLEKLGTTVRNDFTVRCRSDRKLLFVGDLVDRGPKIAAVLRLMMRLFYEGLAIPVLGNRDAELLRYLKGEPVKVTKGLRITLDQLSEEPHDWLGEVTRFLESLNDHHILDHGRLVVAHAGIQAWMLGKQSPEIFAFTVYGPSKNETDEYGLPKRLTWTTDYAGEALVVYGHTPAIDPVLTNKTINIDTGCVYGGKLTALRYPDMGFISVAAGQAYNTAPRPFI